MLFKCYFKEVAVTLSDNDRLRYVFYLLHLTLFYNSN